MPLRLPRERANVDSSRHLTTFRAHWWVLGGFLPCVSVARRSSCGACTSVFIRPLPSRRASTGHEKKMAVGIRPPPDRQSGSTLVRSGAARLSGCRPAARTAAAARAAVSARRMWGPRSSRAHGFRPSTSESVSPPSGPITTRISSPGGDPRRVGRIAATLGHHQAGVAGKGRRAAPAPPPPGRVARRHCRAASRAIRRQRSAAAPARAGSGRLTERSARTGTMRSTPSSVSFWTTSSGLSPLVRAKATARRGDRAGSCSRSPAASRCDCGGTAPAPDAAPGRDASRRSRRRRSRSPRPGGGAPGPDGGRPPRRLRGCRSARRPKCDEQVGRGRDVGRPAHTATGRRS